MLAHRMMLASELSDPVLVDSYPFASADGVYDMYNGSGVEEVGQALTLASSTGVTSLKFFLQKSGSPTGNITFRLYAATGTVGTNATPTGSVLATATLDAATLTTSAAAYELTIAHSFGAVAIAVALSYEGGDASNLVKAYRDGSSPSHAGNAFYTGTVGSSYTAQSGTDVCFELYGRV